MRVDGEAPIAIAVETPTATPQLACTVANRPAVDSDKQVHVVWPSPADAKNPNVMALYYAQSKDGRTFTSRVRLPTAGPAGHVNLTVLSARELLITWDEMSSAGRVVRMARATTDPSGRATFRLLDTAATGKYPAVAQNSVGSAGGVDTIAERPE